MRKERPSKKFQHQILATCLVVLLLVAMPLPAQAATKKVSKISWKNSYQVHTVPKGKKFRFRVNVTPSNATNKKVRFVSSNPAVATVSKKGVVTGRKKGKTVIIAQARDGSGKKASCTVYVGKKAKKVAWKNASATKTIVKGKSFNFNTKVTPATASCKKVKYTTSNKKVATVSKKGVIKGKKNGTVTIKAKSMDGSGKSVTCKVSVITKVSRVTISNPKGSMLIGDTHAAKASISPAGASNKKVTWSSNKKTVAKVSSDGLVTAVGTGTATITAKAADGYGAKASFKVKVTNPLSGIDIAYVAHRGLSADYPENTVRAFQAAAATSFSAVECDVWETDRVDGTGKDIMIMHDESILRTCGFDLSIKSVNAENRVEYPVINGNGNIADTTYLIPTLAEFLRAIKGSGKTMYIELKDSPLSEDGAKAILEIIEKEGVPAERIHFISFYKASLVQIKKLVEKEEMSGFGFRYLVSTKNTEETVLSKIQIAKDSGFDSVGVTKALTTTKTVQAAKAAGLSYHVWTIDDPAVARQFADMGCDSITTNCCIWAK